MITNQASNIELLQAVYKSTCIGNASISKALNNVEDKNLQKDLESEVHELRKIQMRAGRYLGNIDTKVSGPNILESMTAKLTTSIKTKISSDSKSVANTIISENNELTNEVKNLVRQSKNADTSVLRLADDLISLRTQFNYKLLQYTKN